MANFSLLIIKYITIPSSKKTSVHYKRWSHASKLLSLLPLYLSLLSYLILERNSSSSLPLPVTINIMYLLSTRIYLHVIMHNNISKFTEILNCYKLIHDFPPLISPVLSSERSGRCDSIKSKYMQCRTISA